MESVLNNMTVGDVLDLQKTELLNDEYYHYYVEDGVIKFGERISFMERKV